MEIPEPRDFSIEFGFVSDFGGIRSCIEDRINGKDRNCLTTYKLFPSVFYFSITSTMQTQLDSDTCVEQYNRSIFHICLARIPNRFTIDQ